MKATTSSLAVHAAKAQGSSDIYLLKIHPNGTLLDSRVFGDARQDRGWWVESTASGEILVTGYRYAIPGVSSGRHNIAFYRLDRLLQLEQEFLGQEGQRDMGFCVREAHGSGYVILGYSRSFGNFGDFYFLKLSEAGLVEWKHNYPSPQVDLGHEFRRTNDNGYLLFGSAGGYLYPSEVEHQYPNGEMMLIKTDGIGVEQWRKTYGGPDHEMGRAICPSADGGWYLFGSTMSAGAGSWDMWLLKIDAAGDSLWSRTYGGADFEYGASMDVDTEGNLYLLGTTNSLGTTGTPDMFLTKTDPQGNEIWSLTIGGIGSDYGHCVRALPDGGCVLAGDTRSFGQGGQDAWLVRVTSYGTIDLFSDDIGQLAENLIYPNPVENVSLVDPRGVIGDLPYVLMILMCEESLCGRHRLSQDWGQ